MSEDEATVLTADLLRYAARRGISGRTVWRWRAAGLLDGPSAGRPGRGRARGRAEARWPARALAQLDTLDAARRPGHRVPRTLLVHRSWWDGQRPDLFTRWKAARMWEKADAVIQDVCWAEKWKADPEPLVRELAQPGGLRLGRAVRGEAARQALVRGILQFYFGFPATIDLRARAADDALAHVLGLRESHDGMATLGDLLDGWGSASAGRSPHAGQRAAALLRSIPSALVQLVVLRDLAEDEAAVHRDYLADIQSLHRQHGCRIRFPLREHPRLAGTVLITEAVRWLRFEGEVFRERG